MKYKSFSDFWPFYVNEHAKPLTRRLHFVGTSLAIFVLIAAIAMDTPKLFWGVPLAGYFFAWIAHFMVEKNRPATFKHPLYSLIGDFKMFGLMATGKMDAEIERIKKLQVLS